MHLFSGGSQWSVAGLSGGLRTDNTVFLYPQWFVFVIRPHSAAAPGQLCGTSLSHSWTLACKTTCKELFASCSNLWGTPQTLASFSFFFLFLSLPCRPSMSFLIMFLCEQGQGCWHRPGVISLTHRCHEQTRRDHPALCSISLKRGNSFFTSSPLRVAAAYRLGRDVFEKHIRFEVGLNTHKRAQIKRFTRTNAGDNHSYKATQCNHVQQCAV